MTQATGERITDEGYQYITCPVSLTTTLNGPIAGQAGDVLARLVITVSTAATSQVQIQDGNLAAYTIFPNSPGGGIGTYTIDVRAKSTKGAWAVITGAGATVMAVGRFN